MVIWALNIKYFSLTGASVLAWSYSEGNLPVHINDLNCTGNEKTLWECPYNGIVGYPCYHWGDAAMACTGMFTITFYQPATHEARGRLVLRLLCCFRVCIYICESALITCAIITSCTLLPRDLTSVDFGSGCFA